MRTESVPMLLRILVTNFTDGVDVAIVDDLDVVVVGDGGVTFVDVVGDLLFLYFQFFLLMHTYW